MTTSTFFRQRDLALVRRMKEAGCFGVCFGIESADPGIRRAIGKNADILRCSEHIGVLRAAGVHCGATVIFGYPQETLQTIATTLDFCECHDLLPGVGFLQPAPATPVYEWALASGRIRNELEYLRQAGNRELLHVNLTAIPDDEFTDAVLGRTQTLARRLGLEHYSQFLSLQHPVGAQAS